MTWDKHIILNINKWYTCSWKTLCKMRIVFYAHELFKGTITKTAAIRAEYLASDTKQPLNCCGWWWNSKILYGQFTKSRVRFFVNTPVLEGITVFWDAWICQIVLYLSLHSACVYMWDCWGIVHETKQSFLLTRRWINGINWIWVLAVGDLRGRACQQCTFWSIFHRVRGAPLEFKSRI